MTNVLCAFLDGSVELLRDPFQCCVLKNFISVNNSSASESSEDLTSNFLSSLVTELLKLKFYEKNNDLYQFRQVLFKLNIMQLCFKIHESF